MSKPASQHHTADFLLSAPTLAHCPDLNGLPEVAWVGRSNVGKSTCINALLNRKNLAKTSNTPGKTRLMNFYRVDLDTPKAMAFVDLPGYGYAKVSKAEQAAWRKQLEAYLTQRETLQLIIQLIDARVGAQENDQQMLAWLQHHALPVQVVVTKWDKLKQKQQHGTLNTIAAQLALPPEALLVISGETGKGVKELWNRIHEVAL